MFFAASAVLAAVLGAQQALAHIELNFPPPINSKFDPQTPQNLIDYSMTSPLAADGSNYPCKGYNTAERIAALNSVATLTAGSAFHVNMSGSATHGGGSCQFSLSYDGGKTFGVIASIMGGCPISEAYDITIPSGVPSGKKALFAWTWNNKEGNREEYMNCAVVDVKGGSAAFQAPTVYRANTLGSDCIIPEGTEVVYPNPGPQVQFGGSITSSSPATDLSPCSYDENTTVTLSGDGSSSSTGNGSGTSGSSGSSSSAKGSSSSAAVVSKSSSSASSSAASGSASATSSAPGSSASGSSAASSASASATSAAVSGSSSGSSSSGSCSGAEAWASDKAYTSGQTVSYQGSIYTAVSWSQNEVPGGVSGAWTLKSACAKRMIRARRASVPKKAHSGNAAH